MSPVRVLIVDDSATQRHALTQLIDLTPDLIVIGQARDGAEALQMVERLRPDVISMDVRMPKLDGLSATRHIMNACPTPIVVVSTVGKSGAAMELLKAGALAAVEKPPAPGDPLYTARCEELLMMLRLMAGVRVIRHWNPDGLGTRPLNPVAQPVPEKRATGELARLKLTSGQPPAVLAIGASAGGPGALAQVLGALPADFPLPILIVQHLSAEFVPGLASWLDRSCAVSVRLPEQHERLRPGTAYVAPGGVHLRVSAEKRVVLDSQIGAYRHCPAVDALFHSVAEVYGARSVGVVLTGMGDDGAEGLSVLHHVGARTIAQNEESCVVFGMPAAAIARGGAEFVLPLSAIGSALVTLTARANGVKTTVKQSD